MNSPKIHLVPPSPPAFKPSNPDAVKVIVCARSPRNWGKSMAAKRGIRKTHNE